MISIFALTGIGEIQEKDNLAEIILSCCELKNFDVVVVTSKVVSKAEGRIVKLDQSDDKAFEKLVHSEAKRVLRKRGTLAITETRHGFICANSGIDQSNVNDGYAVLLPKDPDQSARRIHQQLENKTGLKLGVIVTDTFGRTWRNGVTDVALGCAGIAAIVDLRGTKDSAGRTLVATEIAVADEIASAAELAKPKAAGTPVVIVRGLDKRLFRRSSISGEIIRDPFEDLFR
ncbi:MAG: coenzyme F420-0:L-glutamate ligase [Acidimicrobiaceae bacterium]|nr:coenzyme F420-0:L-glutamate ligase [Acidimicrobiaceae bacterium]